MQNLVLVERVKSLAAKKGCTPGARGQALLRRLGGTALAPLAATSHAASSAKCCSEQGPYLQSNLLPALTRTQGSWR